MKSYLSITIGALLLSGCATSSYYIHDDKAGSLAFADVFTAKCPSVYSNEAAYREYRIAASKLLSVVNVHQDVYDDIYQKVDGITDRISKEQLTEDCEEHIPGFRAQIPAMMQDYEYYLYKINEDKRRQAEAWSQGLALMAEAASSMNQLSKIYNYNLIPMPSGKVDFGQKNKNSNYNHYLINTPSGMKQCHVASSGYIFCT